MSGFEKCDNCPIKQNESCVKFSWNLPVFSREEIEGDLVSAIEQVYIYDYELITRDASERCINSHIFHYFLLLHSKRYSGYSIDPEYNRNGAESKYYDGIETEKQIKAIPDTIIHVRNCNKHNLLYIEYKKE